MKWFWFIILLLAGLTAVLFVRRERAAELVPEFAASPANEPSPPPAAILDDESPPIAAVPPSQSPSAPAEPDSSSESTGSVPEISQPDPTQTVAAAPPTDAEPAVLPTPLPDATSTESAALPDDSAPPVASSETPSTDTEVAPAADPPALFRDQFEIVPARTRPGEDGFTIYDERFPVKGAGTAEDPIEVTWDLLVSASETFQPRMGKKRLPERIAMLDKKHVRITGYVAFPIMAAAQNEMLSMRNMWDGCCIGVPPTPYDAVEVKLKAAATGRDRFTAFGTVEGVMQVDPYIKGNWLLGLYLMEGATLSQLKEGGDPTRHGGL